MQQKDSTGYRLNGYHEKTDEILSGLTDSFSSASLIYNHIFINHRPYLTDSLLYNHLLNKVRKDNNLVGLMPFYRHLTENDLNYSCRRITEEEINAHLNHTEHIKLQSGELAICEASFKSVSNLITTLLERPLPEKATLLIIIDPIYPKAPVLDELIWRLMRDSRYLNITVWLHASPLLFSTAVLSLFTNAIVLNPTKAEMRMLQNVWGDILVEEPLSRICYGWVHRSDAGCMAWEPIVTDRKNTPSSPKQVIVNRLKKLESELDKLTHDIAEVESLYKTTTSVTDRNKLDSERKSLQKTFDMLCRTYEEISQNIDGELQESSDIVAEELRRAKSGLITLQAENVDIMSGVIDVPDVL